MIDVVKFFGNVKDVEVVGSGKDNCYHLQNVPPFMFFRSDLERDFQGHLLGMNTAFNVGSENSYFLMSLNHFGFFCATELLVKEQLSVYPQPQFLE